MTFNELGLCAELAEAVSSKGYNEPTPIQAQAIPSILEGRDLLGGSQTGTTCGSGPPRGLKKHLSMPFWSLLLHVSVSNIGPLPFFLSTLRCDA